MATMQDNPTQETGEYRVVGTRPIRHDGPDKVTGRARYAADVHPPGFLHGKVLRSPHPHAVIKNIDTSRAQALPGVRAVATSADFPDVSAEVADQEEGGTVNYGFYSRNVMAREKALYRGHAVAAVAATSAGAAEQALALIDVDYEVLPPVLNAEEAMRDGAAVLHDRLLTLSDPNLRQGGYGNREGGSNVANRFEFRLGDPDQGFREADVVVEREFHTRPVHQGYIEPHSATALWAADGNITIWCSSQGHFALRDHTAAILGINVSQDQDYPDGDRRRLRREGTGRLLPGAGSLGAIPEVGPSGENKHDPARGVRGHRARFSEPYPGKAGRRQGRSSRRRRLPVGL